MARSVAVAYAADYFDSGAFLADLGRRVAFRTESQAPGRRPDVLGYLEQEMVPAAHRLGATARVVDNPDPHGGPFLIAHRRDGPGLPTVLTYGHADVVLAEEHRWRAGLDPWRVTVERDRWYGRGTADNKGQHTINQLALRAVLAVRGRLGFNLKVLIETGEEVGSPGLRELCAAQRERLRADVLVASDGPRLSPLQPTISSAICATSLRRASRRSDSTARSLRTP